MRTTRSPDPRGGGAVPIAGEPRPNERGRRLALPLDGWPRITDDNVVEATFSIPDGPRLELELPPRLESWNRYDDPEQAALREFVAHVRQRIAPILDSTDGHLAFRLDVGLPDRIDPLWERDLDNYLFPIARDLSSRVVSVWGTKGRAPQSFVRLAPAVEVYPGPEWQRFAVSRSSGTEQLWKSAVRRAVESAAELPAGPVGIQLAFSVGQGRRWSSLWKSSIDALDRLLGRTYPERDWNPQDGRIVRLGLHQGIDPRLGNDVEMVVYARAADETWPELAWLSGMDPPRREALRVQYRGKLRAIAERQAGLAESAVTRSRRSRTNLDPESRLAEVTEFRNNDDGYLAWLAGHPDGYVINILRGLNAGTARIHRVRCRTIIGKPPRGGSWTGSYIKICADELTQLDRWSDKYVGQALARCGICQPLDFTTGIGRHDSYG